MYPKYPAAVNAEGSEPRNSLQLLVAWGLVYVVWGSTYLAIKIAVKTLPPLLMGGTRFIIAGAALYVWSRLNRKERETPKQWLRASLAGNLFFLIGNGAAIIGLIYIDSGIAALLIALTPIWMVIIDQFHPNGRRPGMLAILGLAVGVIGLYILINPTDALAGEGIHLFGAMIILLGTIGWAAGTIFVRNTDFPRSQTLSASMQMIAGGIGLFIAGLVRGELQDVDFQAFSLESTLAFLYLIFFGAIGAFSAYNWLMRRVSTVMLSTIGYVNPVVALILGATIGGEVLNERSILASAIILTGVFLIARDRAASKTQSVRSG